MVLFLNKDPCPNPELWPNAGVVFCPNSPVLLGVLELLVPKEKELALVTVGAPKSPPPPPVVALLELAPNADWVNEKPLDVPPMLAGCPNPPTLKTDLPNPASAGAPNPDVPNPVVAGAEVAGGAGGWPNTLAAVVGALVITAPVAVVVVEGAAVLMAGMAPTEPLVVVAGATEVKMEPGLSEEGAGAAAEVTWVVSGTAAADVGTEGVDEGSGVASSVEGAGGGGAEGGIDSGSAGAAVEESAVGTGVTTGSVGAADVVVAAVTGGSGSAGALVRSTAGSLVLGSGKAAGVLSEGCWDSSVGAARRLLKDVGSAEAAEVEGVIEKVGMELESGGLNKLPDPDTLGKSAAAPSSADFWGAEPKLN